MSESLSNTTNDNLISLETAVNLTCISKETLLKFVEVGCLTQTTSDAGQPYFNKKELCSVVGLTDELEDARKSFAPSGKETNFFESNNYSNSESILDNETASSETIEQTLSDQIDIEIEDSQTFSEPEKVSPQKSAPSHLNKNFKPYLQVIKIQDQLLSERSKRISSLEKQISWLRSRVETAELSAEREKMLLLTQAKTIQELSSITANRPSFVKGFLQTVGLLPPPPQR